MASPSKDATPMWDIMSPEDDKAVMEKFTAESNKVINRWSLGGATFTEKDAAVAFLVQLGAVEITIQSGSQQTTSQKQVSILFGEGEDPGDIKDAILSEGNSVRPVQNPSDQDSEKKNDVPVRLDQDTETKNDVPVRLDQDTEKKNVVPVRLDHNTEKKNVVPVRLDQDTEKNREAQVYEDDDDEDNNFSVWMTDPDDDDDDDDDDDQIPDTAPVVEECSTTQPREEHPCPDCHTVLHSLCELDLHKLNSCTKEIYNCDQCSSSFTSRGYAVKHLHKVHNISRTEAVEKLETLKSTVRQKKIRKSRAKIKEKLVYNCHRCTKSFTAKGYAVKHLHIVHNMSRNKAVEKLEELKSLERQDGTLKLHGGKRHHVDKSVPRQSKRLLLKLKPLSTGWKKILESKAVDVSEINSDGMRNEPNGNADSVSESLALQGDVKEKSLSTISALESNADHGCPSDEQVQEKNRDDSITREDEPLTADREKGNGKTMPMTQLQKSGRKSSELMSDEDQKRECSAEQVRQENKDVSTRPRTGCEGQSSDLNMTEIKESSHNYDELVDNSLGATVVNETKEVNRLYDSNVTNQNLPKFMTCKFCGLQFKTLRSCDKHIVETHAEQVHEQLYKCSTCNKSYKKKCLLKRHLENHVDINEREKYKCKVCQKILLKKYYQKHMKRHAEKESFICDICGKVCSIRRDLERHINIKHKKEVVYTCEICGRNFYTTRNIKQHLETHTKEKTWKCDECGYAAFREYQLREHMRLIHPTGGKCLCEICGSAYKNANSLRKHIRTSHSIDYKYSCDFCDMKFKSSSHVYCHKKSVHSYKPKNKPVRYGSEPSKPLTMVSDSEDRTEVGDCGHHEISDAVDQLSEASDSQVVKEALLAMMNE